jgi:1-phosphatidylinositol phosphodiesterase
MAPPLTVRNLTSVPLRLKVIERYNAPQGEGVVHQAAKIAGNITSFTNNFTDTIGVKLPTDPSKKGVSDNAQSFAHEEADIVINPFTTNHTDKKASERGPNEVLRLTFEAEGQRYKIDVPLPVRYTRELTPLVPDPRFHFTAVFIPDATFLSIISSSNLSEWMREMADRTPISALSLPGTHNSPTYHKALPSVRCQSVSPREQLDNGVRFFDIRVQPEDPNDPNNDKLILVHSVFPISLTGNKYFRDLEKDVLRFLDDHPSETVVISLKREGTGDATDQQLSKIVRDHYGKSDRWWTETHWPKLGEARKKIVLLRRYALDDSVKHEHDGRGYGIEAENWADKATNDHHGAVIVQDFYELLETENIDLKIKYATEHLERAGSCVCPDDERAPPPPMYLNFLSASNFWKVGCWPEKIAAKLNPAIVNHLAVKHIMSQQGDWGTGVVICDWVGDQGDWDLVRCIVGMNSKLMMRQRR